jgi:ribosomal protein L16 Arg81 hydroxylase
LDFTVHPGHVLYVPPFWHYSIHFLKEESEENHLVHVFNYGSAMNVLSNVFNLGHHYYDKFVSKKISVKADDSLPI